MPEASAEIELVRRAATGDRGAMDDLFAQHRERLKRMLSLRLNPKLRGRVDVSDVIQDVYLDAAKHLAEYLRSPTLPFFVWLRQIAARRVIDVHRKHLGSAARDAGREIHLSGGAFPTVSSAALAARLLGRFPTPPQALLKAEMQNRLQDILNGMDAVDREILVLRHFEQLSNAETAEVLELSPSGASSRYVRALQRLKSTLSSLPGFTEP